MPLELLTDNATTTLTSSPSSGATSFTVASSTGFPAAVTGTSQFRILVGSELITVTNVSGTTWTCVATSAAHTSDAAVTHVLTAASLDNFVDGKIAAIPVMPPATMHSGRYYVGPFSTQATSANTQSMLYFSPFPIAEAVTLNSIAAQVTVLAASSTVRLGIYSSTAGLPDALVLDAGTIDSTSTGAKAITISQYLEPGFYWLAAVEQGGAPTMRTSIGGVVPIGDTSASDVLTYPMVGYSQAGVTGALPANAGTLDGIVQAIRVAVRVA